MNFTIVRHEAGYDIARAENGKLGVLKDGKPISQFKYDEITLWPPEYHTFYSRMGRDYIAFDVIKGEVSGYGQSGGYDEVDHTDGFTVRCVDGMFGLEREDQIILPFEFDEVYKWPDCDVVYTRKGTTPAYYDTSGKRILTKAREITGATDMLEPYYCGEPQTNIIQLMDLSRSPIGEDFCHCYGRRAGLSRRTISEQVTLIKNLSSATSLTDSDFADNLLAWDCYIFSAFMVEAEGNIPEAIDDCFRQMDKMELFDVSWSLIWNFIFPKGSCTESAKEYAKSKLPAEAEDGCGISNPIIAFGEDESLTNGVKIMVTRCFCDHWPTLEELYGE